jgi:hypothetical protein
MIKWDPQSVHGRRDTAPPKVLVFLLEFTNPSLIRTSSLFVPCMVTVRTVVRAERRGVAK